MLKHNQAPKILALSTAVTLGLAACTAEKSEPINTTPSTTRHYVGDDIPPKDTSKCNGLLDGFAKTDWSKDGDIFEVTSISGASCAAVYDWDTYKSFGGLAVGDEFIGGCTFDDKPSRIHVLAPNKEGEAVGDVNLSPAGSEQVRQTPSMTSCAAQGIEDKGFFIPR